MNDWNPVQKSWQFWHWSEIVYRSLKNMSSYQQLRHRVKFPTGHGKIKVIVPSATHQLLPHFGKSMDLKHNHGETMREMLPSRQMESLSLRDVLAQNQAFASSVLFKTQCLQRWETNRWLLLPRAWERMFPRTWPSYYLVGTVKSTHTNILQVNVAHPSRFEV